MRRPLGDTERAIWLLDRAGSLNGAFCARVVGPLDEALLRRALDRVQARTPLLRVRVVDGDPPPFASDGVPPIPLRIAAGRRGDGWLGELEDELNRPFPWQSGPLARVVLLRDEGAAEMI